MRARHLGALGLALSLAVSCVALIGADEEPMSAAAKLCECDKLKFLGSDCIAQIEERLRNGLEEDRTTWMQEAQKKGCFTSCARVLECYRTVPSCSPVECSSESDDECCSGLSCKVTETGSHECQP